MVNAVALREMIPVLRDLEARGLFNMDNWAAGTVNPNANTITECGTQFCVAGTKAVMMGYLPQYEGGDWKAMEATGRFVLPEHRHETNRRSPNAYDAEFLARDAFELDANMAAFLFLCTHVGTVDHIARRIEWLADGEDVDLFPEAWIYEERHANDSEECDCDDCQRAAEDEEDACDCGVLHPHEEPADDGGAMRGLTPVAVIIDEVPSFMAGETNVHPGYKPL